MESRSSNIKCPLPRERVFMWKPFSFNKLQHNLRKLFEFLRPTKPMVLLILSCEALVYSTASCSSYRQKRGLRQNSPNSWSSIHLPLTQSNLLARAMKVGSAGLRQIRRGETILDGRLVSPRPAVFLVGHSS